MPDNVAACCRLLNSMKGKKVALDIPTGLNGDTAKMDVNTFYADLTYAFAAYKPAHLEHNAALVCGEIVCLDIAIE